MNAKPTKRSTKAAATGRKRQAEASLISQIHTVGRILREIVNYPGHIERKNSPEYSKIHKELVDQKNLPCLACGVRKTTLGDRSKNPFGAKHMETHYHNVEWALANALDLEKFNDRVVSHLRARPHHDPIYDQDFTQTQMLEWVDHHPDNLWVLCDVHHRGKFFGIHSITDPIWGPQDLIKSNFKYIPGEGKKMIDRKPPKPSRVKRFQRAFQNGVKMVTAY